MGSSSGPAHGDDIARPGEDELRTLTAEEARDLGRAHRDDRTAKILADADKRDEDAAVRDAVSDERERIADRAAFVDAGATYPGQGERRAAALDRADARTDRESSAEDRAHLTDDGEPPEGPSGNH